MRRLSGAIKEAIYPLLVPGILIELERIRNVRLVESTINILQARMFELEDDPDVEEMVSRSELKSRNQEKRSVWLDTTFLRNCLISWNIPMAKFGSAADSLPNVIADAYEDTKSEELPTGSSGSNINLILPPNDQVGTGNTNLRRRQEGRRRRPPCDTYAYPCHMFEVGRKIKSRNQDIIEEYESKIRDCSMSIEGMEMTMQRV